jgi:hypothetical protein
MKRLLGLLLFLSTSTIAFSTIPTPRVFIGNTGQWPQEVLYGARTADGYLWITSSGLIVDQRAKTSAGVSESRTIQLDVVGSPGSVRTSTTTSASMPTARVYHPESTAPQTNASTVIVHDVLKGIDLEFVWDGDHVRYNILADAGVRIPEPFFDVKGASAIRSVDGSIELRTDLGSVTMSGIVAYQSDAKDVRPVNLTTSASTIGFRVENVASRSPLTIDPIVYARAFHGSADEAITSIKVNKDGNIVMGGWTSSASLSGSVGTSGAGMDGFVAVLSPDLKNVLSWAFIGGDSADAVRAIAIASTGDVWVTGETNTPKLPFPTSPVSGEHSGTIDGFVVRLSPNLSTIKNGMYIPGNGIDLPTAISLDKNDVAAVCGQTSSTSGMPFGPGHSSTSFGQRDGFVLVLPNDGLYVNAFTYFGGAGNDNFTCITHDAANSIIVGGWTTSIEYKTWPKKTLVWIPPDEEKGSEGYWEEVGQNPFDIEYSGGATDGVITKFNASLELIFSTYFGGNGADVINAVACDANDDVHAVGTTKSTDLPTPDGSHLSYNGMSDAFHAVITKDGLRQNFGMYLGGSGDDEGLAALMDRNGNVYMCGTTTSPDLTPIGAGSSSICVGGKDGFLAKVKDISVTFTSLFGWTGDDVPTCLTVDAKGDVFVGGHTTSTLPTSVMKGAGPSVQAEGMEALAAKYAFGTISVNAPSAGTVLCGGQQAIVTWLAQDMQVNEKYSVDVSGDNGKTWTEVVKDLQVRTTTWNVSQVAPDSGKWQFRVRSSRGHAALSATYVGGVVPQIAQQPADTWICPNGSKDLSVVTSGEGVTYQWYKDGLPISGATSSTYKITSATAANAGTYHVVLTNSCGSQNTANAKVTVAPAPVIKQQPSSATNVSVGAKVTLSVVAEGPNLTYQWKHDVTPIPAPLGTQSTLVIDAAMGIHEGSYTCVVGSDCGSTTTEEVFIVLTSVSEEGGLPLANVSIAPQPATENITISMIDGSTFTGVTIRDMHGRIVAEHTFAELTSTSIPLSSIAVGVYAIEVRTSSGTRTGSILIQR